MAYFKIDNSAIVFLLSADIVITNFTGENIMNEVTNIDTDIDYENMDDLPLSDHFEWQFIQTESACTAIKQDVQDEWLAA